jgi:hypothetical protein
MAYPKDISPEAQGEGLERSDALMIVARGVDKEDKAAA